MLAEWRRHMPTIAACPNVSIKLGGIEIARHVARRITRLHLADAANRDDDVGIVGVQVLQNGIDVGNFLE